MRTLSLRPRASRWADSLPLARVLGDPRLGMVGAFLSLRRVIPNHYPLTRDVEWYIADEQRLGRLLDYAVIAPRLQRLYEWSAEVLGEPRLLGLVRNGSPIYAWPCRATTRVEYRARPVPRPGNRTPHAGALTRPRRATANNSLRAAFGNLPDRALLLVKTPQPTAQTATSYSSTGSPPGS